MKALRITIEVLRAAVADLARNVPASFVSIAAMAVAIFLLAAFLIVGRGLTGVFDTWSAQSAIEAYLHEDVPDARARQLARELAQEPEVAGVDFVGAERALREFERAFPDLADVEELLEGNPLPRSLRVVPATQDVAAARELAEALGAAPEVSAVRLDQEWIEALSRLGRALALTLVGGAALLLLAALTTVGSVVRLALDDKREEVELMRLVGAPTSFVIAPVLIGGAFLAGLGAAVAVLAAESLRGWVLGAAAEGPLGGLADLLLGAGLQPSSQIALVLGAAGAGLTAAGLAAGRAAVR